MERVRPAQRAICLICALMLLLVSVCGVFTLQAYAETPSERYKRLQEELEAARAKINSLKSDVAAVQQLKEALEEEKALIDEMVELNWQQIEAKEAELVQRQQAAAEKRQTIYDNEQLLQQRLVAIYEMNSSSILSRLLQAESLWEFLMLVDTMQRVSQHDTDLLALLAQERAQLEAELLEIDALLDELVSYHNQLLQNQQDLAQNLMEVDAQLNEAQAALAAQQAIAGQANAALVQAQKEMAAIGGSIGGSAAGDGSQYEGGKMGWPVPGYYEVSCEFGQPDPNNKPHGGMDVRAPAGTSIVACSDGTVIQATYAHNSYGNYIVVDHGGGIKTLYAHCTDLLASPGTAVKRGDVIATVGSTGFSTGNHLHLEVLDNGTRQNPRSWLAA